ncbi:MAG: squalene--hopene cyclase [Bacteroidales bacterium]|nr:squalene--hopene cyclase [Bacteroidales bacterium]
MESTDIKTRYFELRDKLLSERNQEGYWTGRLSTSALSTAVAIVALKLADNKSDRTLIETGFNWLCRNINKDGGYGDTTDSISNVSTTLLCYAAISYCQSNNNGISTLHLIEKWLEERGINIDPDTITGSVLRFYGNDYTFSVPILAMLMICEVIPHSSADRMPLFPFELTLLPSYLYRFLNLRVVSYALPALIGVGIWLHKFRRKRNTPMSYIRNYFIRPALKKLDHILPESGGFLEAIPLTAFVAMCLIDANEKDTHTVRKGIEFLRKQKREDGGWPIDTDLSTWVTTLSIKALGEDIKQVMNENQLQILRNHLLGLQYRTRHPFNDAKPGGWGWTSYSGSVPDADDTPGAILALLHLYNGTNEENISIENGCRWLTEIQNSDGGFPTFCKGWGKLPFDKSCADLTGHALLALMKTSEILKGQIQPGLFQKVDKSISKAIKYLANTQLGNGAWLPLWFGNQLTSDMTNPVYGTAKVSLYLFDCMNTLDENSEKRNDILRMLKKSWNFLLEQQNDDGSWGGEKGIPGSVEETSLAISALASVNKDACMRGLFWLEGFDRLPSSPIGLYFAMLWYDEKLYPVIYYVEALRRILNQID